MPENGIKMLAMTANCGNGDIGGSGISGIISSIRAKQADIAVINCQEAEVASIMNSLNNGLKDAQLSNFGCVQSELFRTRTKVAQWVPFSNETGIVSVVLFNKDKFNVTHENSNRHVSKTNSNKGCLSSLFSVSSLEDDKKFTIQTISGHLESNNADKRISDWHKLRESISKYAGTDSFDDFASKIPDITITGADLNTRDLDVADENKRNPWNNVSKNSDMKSIRDVRSMHFASVGAQSFTAETTYKTHKPDVEKDSKRPGYLKRGSLDQVSILSTSEIAKADLKTFKLGDKENVISSVKNESRDHAVIISDTINFNQASDNFIKVKNFIINQLQNAAPNLCAELKNLTNSDENKKLLMSVNDIFLSPKGLLNEMLINTSPTFKKYGDNQVWFQQASLENLENLEKYYKDFLLTFANDQIKTLKASLGTNFIFSTVPFDEIVEKLEKNFEQESADSIYNNVEIAIRTIRHFKDKVEDKSKKELCQNIENSLHLALQNHDKDIFRKLQKADKPFNEDSLNLSSSVNTHVGEFNSQPATQRASSDLFPISDNRPVETWSYQPVNGKAQKELSNEGKEIEENENKDTQKNTPQKKR